MATFERDLPVSPLERVGDFFVQLVTAPLGLADVFLDALQNLVGARQMGWVFVLPNLIIFGVFILLPMLLNFYYGFTSGTSIVPENREFIGAANLQRLSICENYLDFRTCEEDLFWRGAGNTVKFVIFEVSAIVVLALVTALALNRNIKGRGFFRSVFFYPVLLSPVVVALIWKWMLQHQNGVVNSVLVAAGGERIPFLLDANWSTFWVVVISVWAQLGFYSLILLAGLQSIPAELYEASSMDGAGRLQRFRYVTLPLIMPTMMVVLVLSLIRAVQVFDLVYVLTGGGPGTATQYLVQYIFQTAFDDRNYGIAAAASLLLALTLMCFTSLQLYLNRKGQEA